MMNIGRGGIGMRGNALSRYKENKKTLLRLNKSLHRLNERMDSVPIVSGKVMKSREDYPYTEEHMTVQMLEPREATELKRRIKEKEICKIGVEAEIIQAEKIIENISNKSDRDILEMFYFDNMTQADVADMVGYTQARISQIISKYTKDL